MESKFATCLNCIDGRVQLPVIQWIKENYDIEYVDLITEAGMDGVLADEEYDIKNILRKLGISVGKHESEYIFVTGHHDCLGNRVDNETHKKHILKALDRIKGFTSSCKVIGLWISEDFSVEKIAEI